MNGDTLFRRFYGKLAREAWLKAGVWGLAAGFAAFAVTAFISWVTNFEAGIWIALGIFFGVGALVTLILYFSVFRPSTKDIARRLDSLGLEERMITMTELRSSQSYIAMRQREDAREKLGGVDPRQISFSVSALSISLSCAAGVLAAGMALLFTLSSLGLLPSGNEIFRPEEPTQFVLVIYMDDEGGKIEGETDQMVPLGSSTEPVLAVADDGYVFMQWSDGVETPSRSDENVTEEIVVFAQFEQVEAGGEGSEGDSSDDPQDAPDDAPTDDPSENDPDSDPSDGQGGAGGTENSDYINEGSGQIHYKEKMEMYYQMAMAKLAAGEELTAEERAFLEAYMNAIR